MRIILSLGSYVNLTGSEIYTYELARELSRRDYKVTILANQIGGEIYKKTQKYGRIKVYPFFDHPQDLAADLVINSQPLPTSYMLRFFPNVPHMQILHSLFQYEEPIIDSMIKAYISVRPEIEEKWIAKMPAIKGKTHVVWNGFDTERFNTKGTQTHKDNPARLFIGTLDQLRQNVIQDLLQDAVTHPKSKLWLMLNKNPFKGQKLPSNITVYEPRWNTESLVKQCDETAGIFVGRTTIEGFLCDKPGLVYDVDMQGNILKKATYTVPENSEIFSIGYMTDRILDIYNKTRYT